MTTAAARRFDDRRLAHFGGVALRSELRRLGIDSDEVAAQTRARRWQAFGPAVVLHNAGPTREQWWEITRANCGPRAAHTSFTAAEAWGLQGWTREEVHVLAPAGTGRPAIRGLVLHRVGDWSGVHVVPARKLHRLAPALILAASSFRAPRPACGILAAAVQQGLLLPGELASAVEAAPRTRHRALLRAALADIAQGAEALSEIDFGRLCRRHGLPTPTRQAVRVEPSGRRRYLDVEWRMPNGDIVAAEVDGAIHLRVQRWVDDQLRQNELVIGGTRVLRYPSVVIRTAPDLVADQLRRILCPRRRS